MRGAKPRGYDYSRLFYEVPTHIKVMLQGEAERRGIPAHRVLSEAVEHWCGLSPQVRGAIQHECDIQHQSARYVIEQAVMAYSYNLQSGPVRRHSPHS
jgi:hypothetical protein